MRVTLNIDQLGHIVGALRERIDGYQEQLGESVIDDENRAWYEEQLAVLIPLERRLTRGGRLEDDRG